MNLDRPILSTDVEQVERPVASRILATLIEASPLAIVAFDPEGVVTMWNPAAERIFGWSEKEAVGMGLPFAPAEKQEEFRALRQRAMRGEVFTEPELYRRRADGSPIVVSVSTSPLRRPDGTIHGIMSILMDVTERKAAEESRARLSMAVEQAGESIIVTDTSGAIRYVNPAFERITGDDQPEVPQERPARRGVLQEHVGDHRPRGGLAGDVLQQEEGRHPIRGGRRHLSRAGPVGPGGELRRRQARRHRSPADGGAASPVAEDGGRRQAGGGGRPPRCRAPAPAPGLQPPAGPPAEDPGPERRGDDHGTDAVPDDRRGHRALDRPLPLPPPPESPPP